ncbi:MAG: PorA family protein [Actinomycetes bacterium]
MKRGFGIVLVGVGVFALVLAGLLRFTVVPAVAQAPLAPGEDTGGVTQTDQSGIAAKLFDPATQTERTDVPLTATRFTRGDVPASQTTEALNANLAIYDSFLRVEDNAGVVVSATTLRVAFDRVSSELSNCCGANYDGLEVDFTGVNPLKFPMFTKAQDYNFFDTVLQEALPITYIGTEEVEGLSVYRFEQQFEAKQIGFLAVPGPLVGSPAATYQAARWYANSRVLYVEPTTGSIVKGEERQVQTLRGPDNTDQVTVIDAVIGTTASEVTESVDLAKSQSSLINLLNTTVPIAALILGLILLAVGIALLATSRNASPRRVTTE